MQTHRLTARQSTASDSVDALISASVLCHSFTCVECNSGELEFENISLLNNIRQETLAHALPKDLFSVALGVFKSSNRRKNKILALNSTQIM